MKPVRKLLWPAVRWTLLSAALAAAWFAALVIRSKMVNRYGEHALPWQRWAMAAARPLVLLLLIDVIRIVRRRIPFRLLTAFAARDMITVRTYVALWFCAVFPLAYIAFGYARWTLPVIACLAAYILASLAVSGRPGWIKRAVAAAAMTAMLFAYAIAPSIWVTGKTFRKRAPVERCAQVEAERGLRTVFANYKHPSRDGVASPLWKCMGGEIFDPYRFIYDSDGKALLMSFEWQRKVARMPLDDPESCSSFWLGSQSTYPAFNPARREMYVSAWRSIEWYALDADTLEPTSTSRFPTEGRWATSGGKLMAYDPDADALIRTSPDGDLMRYSFGEGEFTHRRKIDFGILVEQYLILYPQSRRGILSDEVTVRWPFLGTLHVINIDDLSVERTRTFLTPVCDLLDIPELGGVLLSLPIMGEIKLIDRDTLKPLRTFRFRQGVRAIAYDPGRRLIFGGNYLTGEVEAFSIEEDRIVDRFFAGLLIRAMAFIPERDELYIGSECGIFAMDLKDRF